MSAVKLPVEDLSEATESEKDPTTKIKRELDTTTISLRAVLARLDEQKKQTEDLIKRSDDRIDNAIAPLSECAAKLGESVIKLESIVGRPPGNIDPKSASLMEQHTAEELTRMERDGTGLCGMVYANQAQRIREKQELDHAARSASTKASLKTLGGLGGLYALVQLWNEIRSAGSLTVVIALTVLIAMVLVVFPALGAALEKRFPTLGGVFRELGSNGVRAIQLIAESRRSNPPKPPPKQVEENPVKVPKPPTLPLMLIAFALVGCTPPPVVKFATDCSAYVSSESAEELKELEACPDKACLEAAKKRHTERRKKREPLEKQWCTVDPKAEGC